MTEILWNFGAFVVALGILVTIHEYGHFWVARRCGVKVLRFSVGFGKALWSRTAKDGTEYVVAMIPLGGYVKMLDEREGEVAPEERDQAFNNQPVTQRIAIVAAGPLANFILAILVYIWMFVLGVPALKPYIAEAPDQSIVQAAGLKNGDLIHSVDGIEVDSWQDVNQAIARRMGEKTQMVLQVQHEGESLIRDYALDLSTWIVDPKTPDLLGSLGFSPWRAPEQQLNSATLGEILPGEAADRAGLQKNDQITALNSQPVSQWNELTEEIRKLAGQTVNLTLNRNGQQLVKTVAVGSREINGETLGYLGVMQKDVYEHMRTTDKYPIFDAIGAGVEKTWEITLLSFRLIGKLFTGEVSPQNLSGPISIAQGAGNHASYGFVFFLSFLALISVNLGIINILPIPVLDGGHLLYYFIELVRGKPLSEYVQEIGLRVGLVMVLSLMVFSIFNDISRLS